MSDSLKRHIVEGGVTKEELAWAMGGGHRTADAVGKSWLTLSCAVQQYQNLEMYCPAGHRHVDEGEWATKPHKTHQCQYSEWVWVETAQGMRNALVKCGLEWRPTNLPTFGV
jgi:hypothetical protein